MARSKEFDEEEVLKKAMVLFWQKGYYDTSIKDLIAFLGISNASIYNAFGGKKQLFKRAIEYYQSTNYSGLSFFIGTQENVRDGLTMVFQKIITDDCHDEDCKGCFIVNTTTELVPSDPEIQKLLNAHQIKIEKLFYDFLNKGIREGQISTSKDIKTISSLLYTFMTGLRVIGKSKPAIVVSMASVKAVLSILD